MVLQDFVFLDENDSTGESNPLNCMGARRLIISVDSESGTTIDLDVFGNVDFTSDTYFTLGVTNVEDGTLANSIAANGIYTVDVNGIGRVKIVNNDTPGEAIVFGRLTD